MTQEILDFIFLSTAVAVAFFFVPWLASKFSKVYPKDPFRWKSKQYDKFSF